MLKILNELPRPKRGETLYCNCQKPSCFPCQNTGRIVANTEDGCLQLCASCAKEYVDVPLKIKP